MATDYPIEITDPDGSVRIAGLADFTDPDNQPAAPNTPFKPAAEGSVTVVENAAGDPAYVYTDDSSTPHVFTGKVGVSSLLASGSIDGGALGPTIPYVTVGTDDPGAGYVTPIVVNTTAVTGGSFAWDGSAYQRISAALA